jgi:hypothetical protein
MCDVFVLNLLVSSVTWLPKFASLGQAIGEEAEPERQAYRFF